MLFRVCGRDAMVVRFANAAISSATVRSLNDVVLPNEPVSTRRVKSASKPGRMVRTTRM